MYEKGWTWEEWLKRVGMAKNGCKWLEIDKVVENGCNAVLESGISGCPRTGTVGKNITEPNPKPPENIRQFWNRTRNRPKN